MKERQVGTSVLEPFARLSRKYEKTCNCVQYDRDLAVIQVDLKNRIAALHKRISRHILENRV